MGCCDTDRIAPGITHIRLSFKKKPLALTLAANSTRDMSDLTRLSPMESGLLLSGTDLRNFIVNRFFSKGRLPHLKYRVSCSDQ